MCTFSLATVLTDGSYTTGATYEWFYNGYLAMVDDLNDDSTSPVCTWEPSFTTFYGGDPNAYNTFIPGDDPTPGEHPTFGGSPLDPAVTNFDVDPQTPFTTTEDPSVDFTNCPPGYYSFTFVVSAGTCTAVLHVVLPIFPQPDLGEDVTFSVCTNDPTSFNIYDEWEDLGDNPIRCIAEHVGWNPSSTGISLEGFDNDSTVDNITDDTYTADPLDQPGIYTFIMSFDTLSLTVPSDANYTQYDDGTEACDCANETTFSLEILTAPSAGNSTTNAVCN
jgi:hypothetical protein